MKIIKRKVMRSGKNQSKPDSPQFESGIVITAEIVFAALLLYLTNHPVDLDATLTEAHVSKPDISENILAADFTAQATDIAVASTNAIDATIEPQINN